MMMVIQNTISKNAWGYIYLTLLMLCLGMQLNAQTSIGLKAHYGTSWQEYGELPINGYDQRIDAYGIGVEVSRPLTDLSTRLKFVGSLAYGRRGAACEPGFLDSPLFVFTPVQDATIFTNYLEMPLKLEYGLSLGKRFSLFLQGGAGVAYMTGGYRHIVFSFPDMPDEERKLNFDEEPELNRFDVGLHSALGLGYRVGKGSLRLTGEYYHGLVDVTERNTSRNRSLTIGLGYTHSVGK